MRFGRANAAGGMAHGHRAQRGFSLIELLAAFVIFAIGFGVMMDIASSSLRNTRRAAQKTEAALWAQSKLDLVGVDERVSVGQSNGEFDDHYRWEMSITEWEPPAESAAALLDPNALELYRIELVVLWGERGSESRINFVTVRAIQSGLSG